MAEKTRKIIKIIVILYII